MAPKEQVLSVFGRTVAELRRERGLTQQRLADASGLHRTYIAGVESGRRNISLDAIVKVAHGLGIPPSALFERAEANGLPR